MNFIEELFPSHISHICILFAFDEFHLMTSFYLFYFIRTPSDMATMVC